VKLQKVDITAVFVSLSLTQACP